MSLWLAGNFSRWLRPPATALGQHPPCSQTAVFDTVTVWNRCQRHTKRPCVYRTSAEALGGPRGDSYPANRVCRSLCFWVRLHGVYLIISSKVLGGCVTKTSRPKFAMQTHLALQSVQKAATRTKPHSLQHLKVLTLFYNIAYPVLQTELILIDNIHIHNDELSMLSCTLRSTLAPAVCD